MSIEVDTYTEIEILCDECGEELSYTHNKFVLSRGVTEIFVKPCKNCKEKKEAKQ